MPIFVRGELLQRSLANSTEGEDEEESRTTELMAEDNQSALMRTVLPSYDEESQIVASDPKNALDVIQRTMSATTKTISLPNDLTSLYHQCPIIPLCDTLCGQCLQCL